MPLSTAELGRRLRVAREQAGLKQDDIAKALGLSRASVSQLEGGDRFPNSLQLSRIAELVGEDISALLDPESYEPDRALAVLFRASAQLQDDEGRQAAVRGCARLCSEFSSLEDLLKIDRGQISPVSYDLPAPNNRWDAVNQGDDLADRERNRLNLGDGPIRDFVELLEAQGVRAFELDLPEGVSGLFLTDRGHGLSAIVADGEVPERQRFSYAHEYCHLLADRRRGGFVSSQANRDDLLEVRANSFAASFLLPEGGVRATLRAIGKGDSARSMLTAAFDGADAVDGQKRTRGESIQIYDVVHLAGAFGASYDATLYRLQNLGLLSNEQRSSLAGMRQQAAVMRSMFGGSAPQTDAPDARAATGWKRDSRHRFIHLALECFRRELISRRKFDELRRLVAVGDDEAEALLAAVESAGAETPQSPKGRARESRS